MRLQPFDRHPADVADLESCGSALIDRAREALDNAKLTKDAYSPAIDTVRGMCAPEVQSADRAVQAGAGEAGSNLVWAAVVSRYWAAQVSDFNGEVDRIRAALEVFGEGDSVDEAKPDTSTLIGSGGGFSGTVWDDRDLTLLGNSAMEVAKSRWWAAYRKYIEAGQETVVAMLRDGPTDGHRRTAVDVGAMPAADRWWPSGADLWASFRGIWVPPFGDTSDMTWWALKSGALGLLWAGHGVHEFKQFMLNPYKMPWKDSGTSYWAKRLQLLNPNSWAEKLGRADTKWDLLGRWSDRAFYGFTIGQGMFDQFDADMRSDMPMDRRLYRSWVSGTYKFGVTALGIEFGAARGALYGSRILRGPLGRVFGSMTGGLAGGVPASVLEAKTHDAVVDLMSRIYDESPGAGIGAMLGGPSGWVLGMLTGYGIETALEVVDDAWDEITEGVDDGWDWVAENVDDAWDVTAGGMHDGWNWATENADDAWASGWDWGGDRTQNLQDAYQSLKDGLPGPGEIVDGIDDFTRDINPGLPDVDLPNPVDDLGGVKDALPDVDVPLL